MNLSGPEAPHGITGLREREVAHRGQQGRHWFHPGSVSRAHGRAVGPGLI